MSNSLVGMSSQLYVEAMVRASARGRVNRVRAHRRALEITQADLAEQVGVTRQTIVALEGGDYAPSVYLALALADALGTSVEVLFAEGAVNDDRARAVG